MMELLNRRAFSHNQTTIIPEYLCTRYVCMAFTYSKSKDQPGKVANPARSQLKNRENKYYPVPVRA